VTRIVVDGATLARLDETFIGLVLVVAYVVGPFWTWRSQWAQATRRTAPTPRRAAARGRTHVRAMLAELDPAPRAQIQQARYVTRPAGRHVAVGAW
jgi:hypothetical protein